MRSIFVRSFRGYLVVIVILAILAPVLVFGTVRSRFLERAFSDLERVASLLAWSFEPLLDADYSDLDSVAVRLGDELGIRITVISMQGVVLADSEKEPVDMENHRTRPEVICAFNGLHGRATRYSETLEQEMLYSAIPIYQGDSIPAVVRTSLFLSDLRATMGQIGLDIAIVTSVLLLAGLTAAWFFSRSISRPIRSIVDVTKRVEEGDFSARAAPCSIRELGGLSVDINAMISRTQDLIGQLSDESASREAILASIHEGMVVVDNEGRVLSANLSFSQMACGGDMLISDNTADYITALEFRDYINRTLAGEETGGRVTSSVNVYAANHSPVQATDRTVFTFSDITELDNLMRIKRDFAANVSHELRTPLTSIKGYAETLLDDAGDDDKPHIETILRNTDRLIRLVDDIRILSELEHKGGYPQKALVSIPQVITGMVEIFRRRARAKGLDLILELEDDLPSIQADTFGVEQVLANLLENAIRYTLAGTVTVKAGVRSRYLVIVVSDTGIGIDDEHIPRLFERFYVVDRARSREKGGTGLGLSIVKHIMTLHSGWVRVTSTPGAGSMFTVAFPLENESTDIPG